MYNEVSQDEYDKIVSDRVKKGQFVVSDRRYLDLSHYYLGNGDPVANEYFDNGEDNFGESIVNDDGLIGLIGLTYR